LIGIELALAAARVVAGAIASIAGFGIGSILTPVLAAGAGAKLAVCPPLRTSTSMALLGPSPVLAATL
jgi:hypothetical protein